MTAIVRPEAVTAPGFRSVLTGHTWPASLSNCAEERNERHCLRQPIADRANTYFEARRLETGGDRVIVRGALRSLLVLLTVATLVFVLIHASGDPLAGFTPPGASPEQQAIARKELGLDRPLIAQYGIFA